LKNENDFNGSTPMSPIIVKNNNELDIIIDSFAKEKNLKSMYTGILLGWDRVMIFRFIDIKNGEVRFRKYYKFENEVEKITRKVITPLDGLMGPSMSDYFLEQKRKIRESKSTIRVSKSVPSLKEKLLTICNTIKMKLDQLLSKDELDKELIRARKELELKKIRKEIENLDK